MAAIYRIKCPQCGTLQDISAQGTPCKQCGTALSLVKDGCLQIYRMGSPMGVAAGMGIYLNGQAYGLLANKETVHIPLDAGDYRLHITLGMNRRCNDMNVHIQPGSRALLCYKARIKMGAFVNSIVIEPARPEEMPPV